VTTSVEIILSCIIQHKVAPSGEREALLHFSNKYVRPRNTRYGNVHWPRRVLPLVSHVDYRRALYWG